MAGVKNRIRVLFVTVVLACLICAATSWAEDDWRIEISSGAARAVLTGTDAAAMESAAVSAAMFRSSVGRVEGPFSYAGVSMVDVLKTVGGIAPGQAIRVTARDGYEMVYSYAQVMGNALTFDREGKALRVGRAEMFLAYESDRDGAEKLPRIVLASRGEVIITKGHLWSKSVAKIEVVTDEGGWQISLDGIERTLLDRSTFESMFLCSRTTYPVAFCIVTEKDGSKSQYQGIPLWILVSMIDGGDGPDGRYEFNDDMAEKGYTVRIVSRDGFSAELGSELVARNNDIVVAYSRNGNDLPEGDGPLRLVGDLPSKKHSVKAIAAIQIIGK